MTGLDEAGYIDWKNWSPDQFGVLERGEAHYFEAELRGLVRDYAAARVLEIGFGQGKFLSYCRSKGMLVTGIEINSSLMDLAAEKGFSVVPSGEMENLEQGSFNLICAFDVIEHIEPSELVPFLRTIKRLLHPDGVILLRFPNADSWLGNVNQHGDITHVSAIGYHKLEYVVGKVGLSIDVFRAERRRGFERGLIYGLHKFLTEPVRRLVAAVLKAIYFPGSPIVLSASNVVCILRTR